MNKVVQALQCYDGKRIQTSSGHIGDEVEIHAGEGQFGVSVGYGPGAEVFNRPNVYPDPGPDYPRWMSFDLSIVAWRWWWAISIRLNKETRVINRVDDEATS